jgi:hypothetical protein
MLSLAAGMVAPSPYQVIKIPTFLNFFEFFCMNAINSKAVNAVLTGVSAIFLLCSCTQEQQNIISRDIQNWTGTNGVLEVYAGDKLVRRFLNIDKLSTAMGTQDSAPRPYRYGYGVLDENLNFVADSNEKKVYFEIGDYASNSLFFENPH